MRICLIAHRFYEVNTHMRQFANAFTQRGDVVDVIGVGRKGAPAYELVGGVNVYRLQEREVDERGPLDYLTKMLTFLLRSATFVARRHLKHRYDLIHVQSIPDFLVFAALVPKVLGARVILDLRDLVPELYASKFNVGAKTIPVRLLRFVEKLSALFADHVIVANPIWYERVTARSAKPNKASVFWYYPDQKLFYPRAKAKADGKFIIMYPGTLSWHQGLDIAIKAFPEILRTIPEAELHIQGEGTESSRLMALTASLGLSDKIIFRPSVPTEDIARRMAEADLALVPKRGGAGFGNEAASTKIPEFMALGIPVVAAKTDIERCFFDDSHLCYFRSEDESDLARAVISVYQNIELRNTLIEKGLSYVERNNWQLRIGDYLKLVASLAHSSLTTNQPAVGSKAISLNVNQDNPNPLFEIYKLSEVHLQMARGQHNNRKPGYFKFGQESVCYGSYSQCRRQARPTSKLVDASRDCTVRDGVLVLPFDTQEIVDNLRRERYQSSSLTRWAMPAVLGRPYYSVRRWLPTQLRRKLQKAWLADWRHIPFPDWPVDTTVEKITENLIIMALKAKIADRIPFIWFWPNGHSSCAILTHDVETSAGRDFCARLMDIEEARGVRSSFQVVPQGPYSVPEEFLDSIVARQFELAVHDLSHDGYLFRGEGEFRRRATLINQYVKQWGVRGFRAAVLYHVLDWYDALDIAYDMSVPNAGHLEPQRGGCCTVFPYFIGHILEIPLTTVQDYALFHYLGEYGTSLWKQQMDLIRSQNGLASFLVHPDYIVESRARDVYLELLEYLCGLRDSENVWLARPGDVNDWWRARNKMKLVYAGNRWIVDGPRSDEARVAFARLEGDRLEYHIENRPKVDSAVTSSVSGDNHRDKVTADTSTLHRTAVKTKYSDCSSRLATGTKS